MLLRFSQLTTHKGAELSAIEHAVPMIVFSPDGTVLRANDLFLNTLGFQRDDVIGRHHRIFCDPNYVASPLYRKHWETLNTKPTHHGHHKAHREKRRGGVAAGHLCAGAE